MSIKKKSRFRFGSVLSLGILASTFALTEPAKASTRDDHVNFTFRLWSPYDYTNARPKETPTSMYMRVKSSEKAEVPSMFGQKQIKIKMQKIENG